ncbi:FAD-binding oxidoreductase [Seohaeicola saemankumensis]|nr:FAD-binding oxidoreductase [Seohaeicola saemankumensis]MCA0872790.1 FAD-binding oxidoreductase [Seohaeicola saemankumensis]
MFEAKQLDGAMKALEQDSLDTLGAALRGGVFLPGSADYDEARTLWNSMVDRHPTFVIRALGASDVQKAVNFCRDSGLVLSIRSGGHQIAGHAVADGTVLLDLSHMRSVHVDAQARIARVAPGALLSDVDRETQAHALAVPIGINSTTGIAGLALGGGFGWTTRKFGMTIDNLISAEVVTASGDILTASASSHPDLFWAIRGGGGNFGIVTSFEFSLHDLGPEVLSGLIVHPIEAAPGLLAEFTKIADSAPDELTVWSVMRKAPPLPFLPEEWHGREVLIFAACYSGAIEDGEKAMADLRSLGDPIADVISPHAFVDWQAAFDPLLTPGARNYWKSHDFEMLSEQAIDALLHGIATLPDPACEVFIAHVGGAMARVAANETAYPQRSSHFIMNVHTRWDDPGKDETCIVWARALYDQMKPYSTGSAYVNFMPEDEERAMASAYGYNGQRLSQIKGKYDPDNFFRLNHNILPS